jgi:nicotinamide mononucleotide transporter
MLYLFVFFRVRLYSDVLLQIYFTLTSVYGWYAWTHAGPTADTLLRVTRLSFGGTLVWAGVAIAATAILGGAMRRYTRAALPIWDAAIMVLSLIAQYLLTGKVLESWVLWIAVDTLAVGVYVARRLYVTAGLYGILLALAARGLMQWFAKI